MTRRRRWGASVVACLLSALPAVAFAQPAPDPKPKDAPPVFSPEPLPAAPPPAPPPPILPPKAEPPPGPRRHPIKPPSLAARLEWKWPKFSWGQLGLTIGQGALAIAGTAIPTMSFWKSNQNAFDEPVRNTLRITDPDDAIVARDASDVGLVLLLNQQLVDTLFVTWWYHDKGSTALQMGLIDAQTITFSAGLNSFTAGIVGRQRPYGRSSCIEGDFAETGDCQGNNRRRSFFSGHATAAFTIAALTCVHHINLPLYGGGGIEAVPCIGGMLIASSVALLRVVSDQHYLSDVLVGAAFGTASGFAIPYLFHYMHGPSKAAGMFGLGTQSISVIPTGTGLQIGGEF